MVRITSILGAYLTVALVGCASPQTPSGVRMELPANLTSPCPQLTELQDGQAGTVLRKLIEVAESYYECADKHRALVEAVR